MSILDQAVEQLEAVDGRSENDVPQSQASSSPEESDWADTGSDGDSKIADNLDDLPLRRYFE